MAAASSTSISPFFAGIMEEDQIQYLSTTTPATSSNATPPPPPTQKKKRNPPGTPKKSDAEAEIISLSPKSLMATNRFVCEVCNKGFQREQNLQLHRRGHNLPWKLKHKNTKDDAAAAEDLPVKRKLYVCPEPTCIHHHPSRPLGDLTGIKKHFSRKHGEKIFKCNKCNKKYAVQSDWKAHSKACGTKEYKCGCGNIFNRRDSFITHRAFCEALAQEAARHRPPAILNTIHSSHVLGTSSGLPQILNDHHRHSPSLDIHDHLLPTSNVINSSFAAPSQFLDQSAQQYQEHNNSVMASKSSQGFMQQLPDLQITNNNYPSNLFNLDLVSANTSNIGNSINNNMSIFMDFNNSNITSGGGQGRMSLFFNDNSIYQSQNSAGTPHLSATALLQKAAQIGSTTSSNINDGSFARMENNESQFQGLMDSFADAAGSTILRNTVGGVSQSFEHRIFNSLHQESDLQFGGGWEL